MYATIAVVKSANVACRIAYNPPTSLSPRVPQARRTSVGFSIGTDPMHAPSQLQSRSAQSFSPLPKARRTTVGFSIGTDQCILLRIYSLSCLARLPRRCCVFRILHDCLNNVGYNLRPLAKCHLHDYRLWTTISHIRVTLSCRVHIPFS
jgi:hypothetical protein